MKRKEYELIEKYMQECMKDSAHDKEHVYRVLYNALDIAKYETGVDYDVLIAACLLHDIGRPEQYADPTLSHADVGAEKAFRFLTENGYGEDFAKNVEYCVQKHRFRQSAPPETLESKILFDADKLDVAGALGIARTLLYQGIVGEPLYNILPDGKVSDGTSDDDPSFFQEYKFKLEKMYDRFFTERGRALAASRQHSAVSFYNDLLAETRESVEGGAEMLENIIEK